MNDVLAATPAPSARAFSDAIAEACISVAVSAGPAALAKAISAAEPRLSFRQVLERGGWYRLGGVLDAGGEHIATDLEGWAAAELASHGEDVAAFAEDCSERGLRATRFYGKTHYWVAQTGSGAADFIQLEIEELQETACHVLGAGREAPSSVEELIEGGGTENPTPLGLPFYRLRRLTDVSQFLGRMRDQKLEPQPVHRFLGAWEASSAGSAAFSNHWVLAVREHLDRYRQPILAAVPVAAIVGVPPRFQTAFGARGQALSAALQAFDRQAGYPMAWFFHMITTKAVPHAVAGLVVEDMQSGFAYLPERDLQAVKDWLHRPFGF